MHRNHRRKFNAAQYNYLDHRYFRLKGYRTEYNRRATRGALQHLHHERYDMLQPWDSPRDFCGHFL